MRVGHHRRIPSRLRRESNQADQVDRSLLLEPQDAVHEFEALGGRLTVFSPYGQDPLQGSPDLLQQRERQFHERFSDFGRFFYTIVNKDYSIFRQGILFLITLRG